MKMRMRDVPSISADIRTAMRTDFDGETRGPVVIVAIRARRNAMNGAKYHCGVTAVERLMKASIVTRSA